MILYIKLCAIVRFMRNNNISYFLLVAVLCVPICFHQAPVSADTGPVPSLTLSSPASVFLNEEFSLGVSFSNVGDATGFGPIVELIVPEQANFNGATYLGLAITSINVGIFPADGILLDPLTSENVTGGAPGSRLIVLEYPLGSFTPGQPAAALSASCELTDNATLGVPFNILATPIFRFGRDAVDNPVTDPPIHGFQATATVTPTVIRLTKTTPIHENEVSTGPNFPVTYSLTLDIADNCTVDNITVSDLIPGNLQFLNVLDAAGGTVAAAPSTSVPGGTLSVFFSSITGVVGADRVIQYRVYAPEKNDVGGDVLDPDNGSSRTATDVADASGTYTGLTVGSSDNHTLNIRSLSIQKGVTLFYDPQDNRVSPGDNLSYTIDFQVSDYFSVDNMTVTDNITDGQSFDTSFIPTLSVTRGGVTVAGDFTTSNYPLVHYSTGPLAGITTIDYQVSQQLIDLASSGVLKGGLSDNRSNNVGPTTGQIVFHTMINDAYENPVNYPSGDAAIVAGDSTGNNVVTTAKLTGKPAVVTDSSAASVTVVRPSLVKTLYAIKGDTHYTDTNPQRKVGPGENVTYSIRVTVPTSDTENLTLTDYLPIPFLESTELLTQDAQGDDPPAAGHWRVANDDTMTAFLASKGHVAPLLITDGTENTVKFDYGTFAEPPPPPPGHWQKVIHILFTVTAQSNPMADSLFLANLVNMTYHNSLIEFSAQAALTHIVTQEPALVIHKGVYSTDGDGTISPSPTTQPVTGDLTGANGGDTVTYIFTVENQGSWPADNISVTEDEPSGLMSPSIVSVVNGSGIDLAYTGDLFAEGLRLTDRLAANNGTLGPPYSTDTALITVSFQVDSAVAPRQQLENTASVIWFQSEHGGQNFVQDQSKYQDKARVTIADPVFTKSVFSTSENSTSGTDLAIGENVTFKLSVTLPASRTENLTITDTLPAGLGYIAGSYVVDSVSLNGSLGALTVTEPSGSGGDVIFNFSGMTAVNSDNDAAHRSFDIYLSARVLDDAANNGRSSRQLKNNSAALTWDENTGAPLIASAAVYVVEPRLVITKSFSPNPVDGGTGVTVTLRVVNNGTADAFNVVVGDELSSAGLDPATVTENVTPSGFIYQYVNPALSYTSDGGVNGGRINVGVGNAREFKFNVNVRSDIIAGTPYPNTATENYTSLPDINPFSRSYSATVTEILRARGASPAKSLYATSEPSDISADPNLVVGEVLTYELKFDFPRHTSENVTLVDILSAHTEYISGSALISRNTDNLTATGFTFTALPDVFESIAPSSLSPLSFNLGNVSNINTDAVAKATVTLRLNAIVKNVTDVQRGTLIANQGQVQFNAAEGSRITVATGIVNSYVNIPSPYVTKSCSPVVVQGGQLVTFTITAANQDITRSAPMFNVNVSDVLGVDYQDDLQIVSIESNAADNTTANHSTSSQLDVDIGRINPGEYFRITYTASVVPGVAYGSTISNSVLLTGTSLPGDHGTGNATPGDPGTSTGKRTGDGSGPNNLRSTATQQVSVGVPTMDKVIVNPQPKYSIGEVVTHRITASVLAGASSDVRVSDNLSGGLSFVPGSLVVTLPAGVTTGNPIGETSPFFTSSRVSINDPEIINFTFGSVSASSAAGIIIEYGARVDNITANQDGTVLGNTANMFYVHAGFGEVATGLKSTSITVGLPLLSIVKTITSNTTNLQAGSQVDYQVVITSSGQTTAYNVVFTDNVSAKLNNISNVIVVPGPVAVVAGNNISVGPFSLPVGQTVTISFSAFLAPTVIPGESISNTGRVTYASSAGPGQRVMPALQSAVSFDVDSIVNVFKGLSSELPSDRFAIGATVIYIIKVDIIQGTTQNMSVADVLPAGLAFQGADVLSGNMGISYSNLNFNVSGQEVTATLGDVTNTGDGDPANNYFQVRIFATVQNVSGNQNGLVDNNTATVSFTGGTPQVTNNVAIYIVEPNLVTTKLSDLDEVTLGNQCTFTVTITHSGTSTADAYDLQLVDTLPVNLSYVAGSASLPPAQVDVSGLPGRVVFNVPVLTLAQNSLSFTYRCRVAASAAEGSDLVNRNVLTYSSLTGTNAEKRTGADGPAGLDNYYAVAERTIHTITRTTIHGLKTVIDDDGVPAYGGDILTFRILLTNTGIPATGVIFTDLVPTNTIYVPGSLSTDRGTVDDSGNPLSVNVGVMNPGDTVNISFKVAISADLPVPLVISNTGMINSGQTSIKLSGPSGDGEQSGPTTINAQPRPRTEPRATMPSHGSSVSTAATPAVVGRSLPPAPPVALPNFAVTKICVETQDKSDNVQICLKNTTADEQSYTARLVVSGIKKYPKSMALSPGATSCTGWVVPKEEAGSYRVNINELEMDAPSCAIPAPGGPDRNTLIIIFGSIIILVGIVVIIAVFRSKFR